MLTDFQELRRLLFKSLKREKMQVWEGYKIFGEYMFLVLELFAYFG